ncbi:MAG: LysR family transcriptional regulator [Janthinobacterium lividum]
MRVTLAQLEAFHWTFELGSVQRAADFMHLAQPTVSLRLKELQAALGVPLLERSGRGLRATPAGRALVPRIATILGEVRGIVARSPTREIAGPIRIGLAEGFAVTCLPPLLAALQEAYPALRPEWVVATSTMLEAAVARDALELAVFLNPIGDERLRLVPLGLQPTSWVVPAGWDLKQPATPMDLCDRAIISNPPPSAMHRQILGWFAVAGVEPSRVSICSSVAVIAELVAGGIGMGLLPERMADRYVAEGSMRRLSMIPPVEDGRLFVGTRQGYEDERGAAVVRTISQVLDRIGYLRAAA